MSRIPPPQFPPRSEKTPRGGEQCALVIVTHRVQQRARVADATGIFLMGRLMEFQATRILFQLAGAYACRQLLATDSEINTYSVFVEQG